MPLPHAILGFLEYRPMSGYDLKKVFDLSVSHFWSATQSHIYKALEGLQKDGFVDAQLIPQDGKPNRKEYRITAAGRQELHRWLSTPFRTSEAREPFLIQLYFAGELSDEELLHVLKNKVKRVEERLAVYDALFQRNQERLKTHEEQRDFFLNVVTLEYGILNGHTWLEWLKSVIQRVESGHYTLEQADRTGVAHAKG